MISKDKTFWAVLTVIAFVFIIEKGPSPFGSILQRNFHLQRNPRRGPVRLDSGWIDKSQILCARNCMKKYQSCTSFLFNSSTGLCTPGSWTNEKQPLPIPAEGDFFQSFYCDTSNGFIVLRYGSTVACIARFGPANYTNADAECQRRGAYLMSVKTTEKYRLLYFNVSQQQIDVWVGCDDIAEEGKFIWKEDGQLLADAERSTVFARGEPNDHLGAEDCMVFLRTSWGLADYNCAYLQYYACEMPYR